jgi:phenylpropionate dioxygenase-like ring-hydroxylating dioxygenase large terminal subunit
MAITDTSTQAPVQPQPVVGLPMPGDKAIALDPARRPPARYPDHAQRFPFPVPNGWFIVAQASELGPGEIRRIHYFGRELVLFRTASGEPRLVNAYCAHLGANLAVGGKVDGDGIRCPFHGWCYDGDSGACTDIPYTDSDHIPSQARIRAYPTLERNQMIWAWHHLEGKPPFYDVPEVPEFDDPEWSTPSCREYFVATCCQEMAENNHDFAHFKYVHGSDDIPWDTQQFVTPVSAGDDAAQTLGDMFLTGVSQDIPIWENKIYRETPVLRPSEKPITEHRRWAQQFYST